MLAVQVPLRKRSQGRRRCHLAAPPHACGVSRQASGHHVSRTRFTKGRAGAPDVGARVEGELGQTGQQREPEVHVLILVREAQPAPLAGRALQPLHPLRRIRLRWQHLPVVLTGYEHRAPAEEMITHGGFVDRHDHCNTCHNPEQCCRASSQMPRTTRCLRRAGCVRTSEVSILCDKGHVVRGKGYLTKTGTCGGDVAPLSRVAACTFAADSCAEPASCMRRPRMPRGAAVPSGSVSVSPAEMGVRVSHSCTGAVLDSVPAACADSVLRVTGH